MHLQHCFCDLHIHIGRTSAGRPVKITAARDLTFEGIARECVERKGIDLAGIVDCASPGRICNQVTLLWKKPSASDILVMLVNENLGY